MTNGIIYSLTRNCTLQLDRDLRSTCASRQSTSGVPQNGRRCCLSIRLHRSVGYTTGQSAMCRTTLLYVVILLLASVLEPQHIAYCAEPVAWWKDYHTLVSLSASKEGKEWELGMMAERGAWATGWYGAWWIRHQVDRRGIYDAIKHVEHFRRQGVRNVFYFDAGEFGEFAALVHNRQLVRNQWELRFYQGEPGELMWFGKDGFYREESPLDLPNYRDFGLPAWRLPDGTRPLKLYDLARISFEGVRDPWDYSGVRVSPEIARSLQLDDFLSSGTDPIPPEADGSLGRICSYDHSNPFLLADFQAGVKMMLTLKPDFLHFDNYFDNELVYPQWHAFGPWSLERFHQFAKSHVEAADQTRLGIDDRDTFDLKQYILDKPYESKGHRWHFRNTGWQDDPIWNLFVCSKLADSDQLFRQMYAFCKSESGRLGAEVVVVGNTIPVFPGGSLVSGALDMAHFEHHAATQYGPLVVPTGLPPLGRLGGIVRLGAAVSRAGYCWPSVYVPQELSGQQHQNLHKVMAMDCLANKGVLDYHHQYQKGFSPGSDDSAAWTNCFIKRFSSYYGARAAVSDVAVVFPGQTLLASVTVFCMEPELCLYDYLGWTQALTELHCQWDAVPDDQLTLARLKPHRVVVIPSGACLADQALETLEQYVVDGGRLIVSGSVGTRHGLDRFLWYRADDDTLRSRLQRAGKLVADHTVASEDSSCIGWDDPPGKAFYLDVTHGQRSQGLDSIQGVLAKCLPTSTRRIMTDAPRTIGVFAYSEQGTGLAVDLVNYAVDPPTDHLQPSPPVTLQLQPLDGRRFSSATVRLHSPDFREPVAGPASDKHPTPWSYQHKTLHGTLREDGALEVTVPSIQVYCRLSAS